MSILVKGAQLPDGRTTDLFVDNGVFGGGTKADTTIDAAGLIALPGLVDLHTHLREPGSPSARSTAT
jgi:dihydroorotase